MARPFGHFRLKRDAFEAEKDACDFGVEDLGGIEAEFAQARQILIGRVEDPHVRRQEFGEGAEAVFDADGVDEEGSRALSADLDDVRPSRVADAHGAFGVDGERAASGGQSGDGVVDVEVCQLGDPFAWDVERLYVYRIRH